MIKAVLFDIGGVLFADPMRSLVRHIAEITGADYNTVKNAMWTKWGMYKENRVSADEFWQAGLDKIGASMDIDELKKKSCEMIKEIGNVLSLVKKLKEEGYKLGIISNNTKEWFEYEIKEFKLDEIFDSVALSCDAQVSKPNERLYKSCIEKINLKPEECVYIDDKDKNLKPAEKLGMRTIHFENEEQLKSELKSLGVKI
jgi:epoxide hydrolase-like predicted phosphatase